MQVESSATTLLTIVTVCYAQLITQWLSVNKFAWETSITFVMVEIFCFITLQKLVFRFAFHVSLTQILIIFLEVYWNLS